MALNLLLVPQPGGPDMQSSGWGSSTPAEVLYSLCKVDSMILLHNAISLYFEKCNYFSKQIGISTQQGLTDMFITEWARVFPMCLLSLVLRAPSYKGVDTHLAWITQWMGRKREGRGQDHRKEELKGRLNPTKNGKTRRKYILSVHKGSIYTKGLMPIQWFFDMDNQSTFQSRKTHAGWSLTSFCLNYLDLYFTFPLSLVRCVLGEIARKKKNPLFPGDCV